MTSFRPSHDPTGRPAHDAAHVAGYDPAATPGGPVVGASGLRARAGRVRRGVRRAVLRRRRPLAALLVAVAVAAGVHASTATPPARVRVPVAAHDLPAGTLLGADDLAEASFAPGSVPEGLDEDPAGRQLAAPVRSGEPVTDVRLVGPALADAAGGLTAVPLRLPDAGMAGLLRTGDRIDLLAADPQALSGTAAGTGAARTVAAGAVVLAVPSAGGGASAGAGPSGSPGGRLVVVGVPATQVESLADAAVRSFLTFAWSR